MFSDLPWYEGIHAPSAQGEPSAWYLAKDPDPEWNVCVLRAALKYAESKSLWSEYRDRFGKIRLVELSPERARAENRDVDFPIWELATEIFVAAYLEHFLGWTFDSHEPPGHRKRLGDWQFREPSGSLVFVEVKTLCEPPWRASSGFRRSNAPRLQNLLARAYHQLPDDGRATLVVVVGYDFIRLPPGPLLAGDLGTALFGEFVVRFPVMVPDSRITYAGPSFHNMLLGHAKHRRLGVVAGFVMSGRLAPAPTLYALHNPFANDEVRVPAAAFGDCLQFVWPDEGGHTVGRVNPAAAWNGIRSNLLTDDSCAEVAERSLQLTKDRY